MNESNGNAGTGGKRLAVYAINEKDGERAAWWQKIGMAFTNRDGSITLYLDALPLGTNKLQVREQREEARPQDGARPTNPQNGAARRPAGEEVRP